jgi:hypothetical protein
VNCHDRLISAAHLWLASSTNRPGRSIDTFVQQTVAHMEVDDSQSAARVRVGVDNQLYQNVSRSHGCINRFKNLSYLRLVTSDLIYLPMLLLGYRMVSLARSRDNRMHFRRRTPTKNFQYMYSVTTSVLEFATRLIFLTTPLVLCDNT